MSPPKRYKAVMYQRVDEFGMPGPFEPRFEAVEITEEEYQQALKEINDIC